MLILMVISQVYWLDEVVVTATRYPEELARIPVAVSVIEKDELDNFLELNDALSGHTGIRPLNYGFGSLSTVGIRGMPSDETLVLIDGIPVNSVATGVGDISFIPVELVERVEVVKGPASSIYGSNAVGGVVNIVTRKDGFIKTGIGNHSFWGLHSSGSIGQLVHIGGGGIHWDGNRTNDEMSRYFVGGKLNIGRFNIGCRYAEKQFGLPGPVPGEFIPEFGDSTANSIFDQEADQRVIPYVEFDMPLSQEVTITEIIYLNYYKINYETYYRHYIGFPALEKDNYKMATAGSETQFQLTLPFDNRFSFGLSYNYDTLDVHAVVGNDSTKAQFSEESWQRGNHRFGGWVEDRQTISRLDVFGAIRYDRDKRFESAFSPSLGMAYLITDRIRFRSHWGMAYRIPTFNDLYWPNSGNPDLKPENGMGIEAGIDLALLVDLNLSLTGFQREITDKIAWIPTGSLWQPQNVNKVRSRGLELELQGQPVDILHFQLGYTLLDPKQINQEPIRYDPNNNSYQLEEKERILINTPQHSARATVTFNFKPYQIGFTTVYTGRRYAYFADYMSQFPEIVYDEKEIAPAFATNMMFGVRLSNFNISLGVENLTGREDPVQFGNSIDDKDYPRSSRTFKFEATQQL